MNSLLKTRLPPKVAIVHEWFHPKYKGGAEQVVRQIDGLFHEIGLEVKLAALIDAESKNKDSWLYGRDVLTSFIQNMPSGKSNIQSWLPFLPLAIEQLDLSKYKLIVSSSHLVAKGILTSPEQLHISYVHTPARYAWDQMQTYLHHSRLVKMGLGPLITWQLHRFRQWDQLSASRVDLFIANSHFTSQRIAKYWGRKSEVIHPPVDLKRFSWRVPREDFYLCVCRLVPNKRVDILVKAFNNLNLPLVIVGDGSQNSYIKKIASKNIKVLGSTPPNVVEDLMSRCRAFVYSGFEDFGIAPVEAMASGAPVIAYGAGGILDSVKCISSGLDSPTGLLFPDQSVNSLIEAVKHFENKKLWKELNPESIREWSESFSSESFAKKIQGTIIKAWDMHNAY